MFEWFKAAMALASRSNRSLKCSCEALIATMRSRRVSRAFHTSPMPPAPIGARISYGPSFSPTDSGIGLIQLSLHDPRGSLCLDDGVSARYFPGLGAGESDAG